MLILINSKTYLAVLTHLIQISCCRLKYIHSNWMYFMARCSSQNNVILLRPQLAQRLYSQFLNINSLFGLDVFQKKCMNARSERFFLWMHRMFHFFCPDELVLHNSLQFCSCNAHSSFVKMLRECSLSVTFTIIFYLVSTFLLTGSRLQRYPCFVFCLMLLLHAILYVCTSQEYMHKPTQPIHT